MMHDPAVDHLAKLLRAQGIALGKYRGVVTKVDDQELGRIKATCDTLFGTNVESPWIAPAVPFAGNKHGFAFLPEKGDGVWIEFEANDISLPIWTGFYWGKKQPLPAGANPNVRVLGSSHGHQYVIDDKQDEIRIVHGGGPSLVITKSSITLQVGGKKLVLSASGLDVDNGALTVK